MSATRPRRSRSDRTSRHAQWYSAAALLGSLLLLGAFFYGVFKVRTVDVVGSTLPSDAVVQTAGVLGSNVFTVRSDTVIRRLATIREVSVQRVDTTFPGKVTIYLTMRKRFLAWQDGAVLYEVDPDGRIIDRVQHTSLPIIKGTPAGHALSPGTVQAVRYAAEVLPRAPKGEPSAFELSPRVGLVITGKAGWTANIGTGTAQQLVYRISELAAVLRNPRVQSRTLDFVDLRYATPDLRYVGS